MLNLESGAIAAFSEISVAVDLAPVAALAFSGAPIAKIEVRDIRNVFVKCMRIIYRHGLENQNSKFHHKIKRGIHALDASL